MPRAKKPTPNRRGHTPPPASPGPAVAVHHNNFTLIRLIASLSVVVMHVLNGPMLAANPVLAPLGWAIYAYFPGVIVFFVTSGYLITGSYLARPAFWPYLRARFLRIWPPLAVTTAITGVILAIFGHFAWGWVFDQLSIVRIFKTSAHVAGFTGGIPNGPLWTLPVEAGFYLMVPLLLHAHTRGRFSLANTTIAVLAFMLLAFILVLNRDFNWRGHPNLGHGPLHHFWYFGLGMLLRLHWSRAKPWLENRWLPWLLAHLAWVTFLLLVVHPVTPGNLLSDSPTNLLFTFTLPGLVMALAYSYRALSSRLLGATDLSYGLYLVHVPFLMAMLHAGYTGLTGNLLALTLTFAAATLIWHLVEKPLLNYKQRLAL